MVNEVCEVTSVGNNFNQPLQQLAKEAQQHPPRSHRRQLALSRLVGEILKSDRLGHPQRGLWSASLYEDFYNEALQKTLLEICQKIDNYNPGHPVMAWVNFLLKIQFINVVNDYNKKGIPYIPNSDKGKTNYFPFLDDIDQPILGKETLSDAQLLRQFLEDDPENRFRTERIRGRPEVTFQSIAWAKFVEDQTWSEISNKLGISIQTLCSFFNRRLQKLMPYFHKYLQE